MPEATDEMTARALAMFDLSEDRLTELDDQIAEAPGADERLQLHYRWFVEIGRNAVLRELLGKDTRDDERKSNDV